VRAIDARPAGRNASHIRTEPQGGQRSPTSRPFSEHPPPLLKESWIIRFFATASESSRAMNSEFRPFAASS
jgi:hypothetical protein